MFNALKSQKATDKTTLVDVPGDHPASQKEADVMVTENATISSVTTVPTDDTVIGDTTTTGDNIAGVTVSDVTVDTLCSVDKATCGNDKLAVRDTSREDIIEELKSGETVDSLRCD